MKQKHNSFNKLILILALISLLLLTNASAFLIGGDGSSSFFNGTIDELVIYNRSLTLAEVEKQTYDGAGGYFALVL